MNNAPEKYWDFAVELATEYLNHIATRKLGWKTPHECHFGDTPDLSVFQFLFYEQIHYLEPNASFPKPNMLPCLGIARTTGDAFTCYVLTKSEKGRDVIFTRKVVRKHLQCTSNICSVPRLGGESRGVNDSPSGLTSASYRC